MNVYPYANSCDNTTFSTTRPCFYLKVEKSSFSNFGKTKQSLPLPNKVNPAFGLKY